MHKVKIKKSGKGLYDYDLYPISLFPDIHVGQDRHGYFSCVASGSIAVCTNVGSEKVCIIYSFDIADKPSVHILARRSACGWGQTPLGWSGPYNYWSPGW